MAAWMIWACRSYGKEGTVDEDLAKSRAQTQRQDQQHLTSKTQYLHIELSVDYS